MPIVSSSPMAVHPNAPKESSEPSKVRGERVSAKTKVGLGLGTVASQGPHNAVHTLSHQVLNMSLGINPALITILAFTQRMCNATLDPLFGRFSDNLRTRFGRRRPLLLVASFPLAACFVALWWFPRSLQGTHLFAYLLATSVLLYASISAYSVALGGLQLEAAAEYHERTRVVGFMQLCFLAFTIAVQWIFPAAESFQNGSDGLRWIVSGIGALFLAVGLTPVFLLRERLYAHVAGGQKPISLREAFRAAKANPTLVRLITAQSLTSLGFYLASPLGTYLNYYYLFPGDLKGGSVMQAYLGTSFQLSAFASVFVFRHLSRKLGKPKTFQIAAAMHVTSSLAKLFAYQPGHPWYQIVIYILNGAGFAGVELLAVSMLADIIDVDEWHTGSRSESVYWAIVSLCEKSCGAFGTLLSGFVIVWIGFKAGAGLHQAPGTLHLMQLLYAGFPFVGATIAILAIRSFAITERSAMAMKQSLEERRARVSAGAAASAET